jgi:hypothetical protein
MYTTKYSCYYDLKLLFETFLNLLNINAIQDKYLFTLSILQSVVRLAFSNRFETAMKKYDDKIPNVPSMMTENCKLLLKKCY